MDFASSSLFTSDFCNENALDFTSLITPSSFLSFQESNSCNIPNITLTNFENDQNRKNCDSVTTIDEERKNKRLKHREIEKQRRQEVTSLFKNLRSILPFQYIKGKRSSSDHVFETVNYIKDLQNKIKDLEKTKYRIKRSITYVKPSLSLSSSLLSPSSSSPPSSLSSSTNCSCIGDTHIDVVVKPCLVGIEIITSCCLKHNSCLSSVLEFLAQQQCLDIVSCISIKLHQRFMHTIVSKVDDGMTIIYSELQEKINKISNVY